MEHIECVSRKATGHIPSAKGRQLVSGNLSRPCRL